MPIRKIRLGGGRNHSEVPSVSGNDGTYRVENRFWDGWINGEDSNKHSGHASRVRHPRTSGRGATLHRIDVDFGAGHCGDTLRPPPY